MLTRPLVLALASLALACASAPASAPARPRSASELADAYVRAVFDRHPEAATAQAYPGADHGRLTDPSAAAERAWYAEEDRFLAEARALPAGEAGSREWLARGIVVDALEGAVAWRACHVRLWSVSSINGWQSRMGQLAALQPVGTAALRDAAVKRLSALPAFVDAHIANLREGLKMGYAATRENVERVLLELDSLGEAPAGDSALLGPARRDPDPEFRARMEKAITTAAVPAIRRYRDFLRAAYLQRARVEQGVSTFPGGEQCYSAAVRHYTTMTLSPQEVHDLGLARIRELDEQMRKVGQKSFGTADVRALLQALRTDARYTYRTSDEILGKTRAAIGRAQAAVPRWFGRVPSAPVRVEPYPAFQARSSPIERYAPSIVNGKLEGVYFINVFDPTRKPRDETESTAFHETVPGHHFQIALGLERADLPDAARYLINSGFVEGWALYAERLADEMGVYGDDVDRMGLLASESFRAARLVVDSGLHVKGWSRSQAVEYMLAHSTVDAEMAGSEVDRYAADPGQATAYMVGALEIRKLRDTSRAALGARFDVRAFHDAVLANGVVTLPMLREAVGRWASRGGAAAP